MNGVRTAWDCAEPGLRAKAPPPMTLAFNAFRRESISSVMTRKLHFFFSDTKTTVFPQVLAHATGNRALRNQDDGISV